MDGFLQTAPSLGSAWDDDDTLRATVAWHLGKDMFDQAAGPLAEMGRIATSPEVLALAARAEAEPPVHIPYSTWGERIDEIRVSDAYVELGKLGVAAGVTALPYEETSFGPKARVVWGALVAMWGPSSALYSCPVAMTDAAARTLLVHGGVQDLDVVGRLTTRDVVRAWTSGQWMTEMTGGSDVSGTATVARRDGDGTWRLHGTKWFTSATTSEMALTLARPEGGAEGSRGLALFRIHRALDDGSRNAIVVRRLKDKLGTRSLPTAELELQGAIAHAVGDPLEGGGVRRIATMLNITRIHNAIAAAGALGRGLAWATAYARVRKAFGRLLIDMPAHRETLDDLAADHAASVALVLRACELTGLMEAGRASEQETSILRGLTPVAKLATARWAVAGAAEAMEALGGVGYCEDSPMPALVRNAHVLPIWEGTTNVLALDLLRAEARSGSLTGLLADARRYTAGATAGHVADVTASVNAAIDALGRALHERSAGDPEDLERDARKVALAIGSVYACALLVARASDEAPETGTLTAALARRLCRRGLVPANLTGAAAREELGSR